MEKIKKNVLIAELSSALDAFQKAEDIHNEDMMEILGECMRMWKRKQILEKINKKIE